MKKMIFSVILFICILSFSYSEDLPILVKLPEVKISSDGSVDFSLETSYKTDRLRIYFGIMEPDKKYPAPRYHTLLIQEDAKKKNLHTFNFKIDRFESSRRDAGLFKEKGYGIIYYQIVIPAYGGEDCIMGRFGFQKKAGGYERIPVIIEGPFVDQITETSAIISYEIDNDKNHQSSLNIDGKIYLSKGIKNEIKVEGLKPGKSYTYQIKINDTPIDYTGKFTTDRGKPEFKFAVFCDSRGGYGYGMSMTGTSYGAVYNLMIRAAEKDISFAVFPGDMIDGYSDNVKKIHEEYATWKKAVEPIGGSIPVYEGVGNHEMVIKKIIKNKKEYEFNKDSPYSTEDIFASEFVNPLNGPDPKPDSPLFKETVYSFKYGSCTFIMLNNCYNMGDFETGDYHLQGYLQDIQLDWLENELKKAQESERIFVFLHLPPFPNGGHLHDSMYYSGKSDKFNTMREKFTRMLSEYNVDIVFAGHEHNYNRMLVDKDVDPEIKNPYWQVITGGAGAPFYVQDKKAPWKNNVKVFSTQVHYVIVHVTQGKIKLTVYSDQDQVIDEFVIE
ncbi:MAG: metallophosphoesterase [bacterium]|nr:metallophosphoesterase [bacterium]